MNTNETKRIKKIIRFIINVSFVFFIGIQFLQIPYASCIDTSKLGESGKVTYVVDGDTFDVESVGRVRLADVNTPEIDTQAGKDAKTYVKNLIDQEVVYLDIDDKYITGYYGRYIAVAYVPYNNTHLVNLNQLLLQTGYAEKADYDNEFNPDIWETGPMEYVKIPDTSQNSESDNSDNPDDPNIPDNPNDSNPDNLVGTAILIIGIFILIGVSLLYAKTHYMPKFSPTVNKHRDSSPRYTTQKKSTNRIPQNSRPSPRENSLKLGKIGILKREIEGMLSWSSWRVVQVQGKKKHVRNAHPTEKFWKIWRNDKRSVKELGFSVSKYNERWQVSQWETFQ